MNARSVSELAPGNGVHQQIVPVGTGGHRLMWYWRAGNGVIGVVS